MDTKLYAMNSVEDAVGDKDRLDPQPVPLASYPYLPSQFPVTLPVAEQFNIESQQAHDRSAAMTNYPYPSHHLPGSATGYSRSLSYPIAAGANITADVSSSSMNAGLVDPRHYPTLPTFSQLNYFPSVIPGYEQLLRSYDKSGIFPPNLESATSVSDDSIMNPTSQSPSVQDSNLSVPLPEEPYKSVANESGPYENRSVVLEDNVVTKDVNNQDMYVKLPYTEENQTGKEGKVFEIGIESERTTSEKQTPTPPYEPTITEDNLMETGNLKAQPNDPPVVENHPQETLEMQKIKHTSFKIFKQKTKRKSKPSKLDPDFNVSGLLDVNIIDHFCDASEEAKSWIQMGLTACESVFDKDKSLTNHFYSKICSVIKHFVDDVKKISQKSESKAAKVQATHIDTDQGIVSNDKDIGNSIPNMEYGDDDTDDYEVEDIKMEKIDSNSFESSNCKQTISEAPEFQFENILNKSGFSVKTDPTVSDFKWKCEHCTRSFQTRRLLVIHRKIHTGTLSDHHKIAMFECHLCSKKFHSTQLLKVHTRLHTSAFECEICKETFASKYKLQAHQVKRHANKKRSSDDKSNSNNGTEIPSNNDQGEESSANKDVKESTSTSIVTCSYCNKNCGSKTSLYKHIKRLHERPFKCAFCKKTFGFATELDAHVRVHTGERPYRCTECEHTFYYRQAWIQHKKLHVNERPFKCTQCDAKFNYKFSLVIHTQRKHTDIKNFKCDFCGKGFVEERELKWHQFIHTGVSDHKCDICDKYFSARGVLRKHIKDVHNINLSSIDGSTTQNTGDAPENLPNLSKSDEEEKDEFNYLECIECGKSFDTNDAMESHYKSMHLDNPNNICHICEKSFSTRRCLRKHIKGVHQKSFQCDICSKSFGFLHLLESHKLLHTSNKDYSCTICNKQFHTEAFLERHQRVHLELKPFPCSMCDKRCATKAGLDQHVARKHSTFRPLKCKICDKGFIEEKELSWHMFSHTGKSDYQCHKCGRYFCAPHSLNKHIKVMHKDAPDPKLAEFRCLRCEIPLQDVDSVIAHEEMHSNEVLPDPDFTPKAWIECVKCTAAFATSTELQEHIKDEHLVESVSHQCESCGKLCPSRKSLYSHVRRVHEKAFKCDQCDKAFGFLPELETHKRTHTGEKPYVCEYCDKSFHDAQILRQHRKVHVADSFACPQCDRNCTSKSSLQKHILRKHTNEKPFKCEYCSKGFVTAQELSWHIFSHTGKSKYYCTICKKYFSAQNVLAKHIKQIHRGEKQLCPICGKHVSGSLNIHVKAHTEKQFKCTICDKSYAWGHLLKEHERTHTGEMPYTCQICFRQFLGSANFTKHKKSHAQSGDGYFNRNTNMAEIRDRMEPPPDIHDNTLTFAHLS